MKCEVDYDGKETMRDMDREIRLGGPGPGRSHRGMIDDVLLGLLTR
jgi:hypothetical protein